MDYDDINNTIEELMKRRDDLVKKSTTIVDDDLKKICTSDPYHITKKNASLTEDNSRCSICLTDFSILCLFEKSVISDFLFRCLKCAFPVCYKCLSKTIVLNPLHRHSIGIKCTQCKFFNCNVINKGEKRDSDGKYLTKDYLPFESGVSTLPVTSIKGDTLTTSNSKCIPHYENDSLQCNLVSTLALILSSEESTSDESDSV